MLIRIALILIALMNLGLQYYYINCVLDDPFISFRYADNLAAGNGLVFNIAERVEGFSNPLWTLGFSLFSLIGSNKHYFDLLIIAKIIGAISAVFAIFLTYNLSQALDPGRRISPAGHLIAPLLVGICPYYALWAQGGLETTFLSLLVLIACYYLVMASNLSLGLVSIENPESKRKIYLILSGLFFGLASLTRPEIPLLFIAGFGFYIIFIRKWSFKDPGILIGTGIFVALVGGYELFRIIYYGDVFPNSYYAKTGGGWPQWLFGLVYLQDGLRHLLGPLPITILVFGPIFQRTKSAIISKLLFTIVFAYFLFIILAGGDWMPKFRFFAHIFPLIAALTWFQAASIIFWLSKLKRTGVLKPFIMLIFLIALAASSHHAANQLRRDYFNITGRPTPANHSKYHFVNHWYTDAGLYMKEHSSPDDYVALGEAGAIPYIGGFKVIDCYGLIDPHIARLKGKRHFKFDADYIMNRKPDWILILGNFNEDGSLTSLFTYAATLLDRKDFQEYYTLDAYFDQLLIFKRKTQPK